MLACQRCVTTKMPSNKSRGVRLQIACWSISGLRHGRRAALDHGKRDSLLDLERGLGNLHLASIERNLGMLKRANGGSPYRPDPSPKPNSSSVHVSGIDADQGEA